VTTQYGQQAWSACDVPPDEGRSLQRRLACPNCGAPLQLRRSELHCGPCAHHWKVIDGVPHFINEFPYWGEIPLPQMQQVNRDAAGGSWRAALTESPDPTVRQASEMFLSLDRANWLLLAELPTEGRVLDVGAGMGASSHALARRFAEVVALEPVAERVEFMTHRFRQERLDNIQVVRSSVWSLPFPEESFDLIVLSGVLEWLPKGIAGDPRRIQLRALANMYRLLRRGGILYLGIENRFAAGYFIGYRDPHCALPWVTILPRPLAHLYARVNGQPNYPNYLYSSRGYRKLLFDAGFSSTDIYAALPSNKHPRFFVPLSDNLFRYYYRNHAGAGTGLRSRAMTALGKLGLLKYAEYSFAIFARK